jgi:demethylmenaquinone methyltransferase/2-methoxy-6-polyprenyl-1,4-benzoquinol methylase
MAMPPLGSPLPDRTKALASYSAMAEGYDATCKRILGIRADAVRSLALREGETVFDVACGTGSTLVELARLVGATGRVVGIEQCPEMASQARAKVDALGLSDRVTLVVSPVEEARLEWRADALLFCYTHDVLQSPAAVENLFNHVNPGARVAIAGLRLRPWWWGWPLNLFNLWRTRAYLTTYRGLMRPWSGLLPRCPELRVVENYHWGMSYRAFATVRAGTRLPPGAMAGA